MANLKVTPQELNRVSTSMRNSQNAMTGILATMGQSIAAMQNDVWDSASGRAFDQQFQVVRNNCTRALSALATHNENLAKAAGVYEQMEAEQQSKVRALDSSNIF